MAALAMLVFKVVGPWPPASVNDFGISGFGFLPGLGAPGGSGRPLLWARWLHLPPRVGQSWSGRSGAFSLVRRRLCCGASCSGRRCFNRST